MDIRDFIAARLDDAQADVKAKRAILDQHLPERAGYFDPKAKSGVSFVACEVEGNGGTAEDAWPCDGLEHLAAEWSGHPDFGKISRPSTPAS